MSAMLVRLKILLREQHIQTHGPFCREYDKIALTVDPELVRTWPSRAQFQRWLSGDLKGLPHPHHCRVLEKMFPGYSAAQLFEPCPPDPQPDTDHVQPSSASRARPKENTGPVSEAGRFADVSAIFSTRAEFTSAMPPPALFDNATEIKAAGLSLNLLCQQYPDQRLYRLIEDGTSLHCLFLDPDGRAIQAREKEEGYTFNHLTTLTKLNISLLARLRDRLSDAAKDRLTLAVYDETIRFNIILIDGATCIMQPYLPQARGVDAPTFVIEQQPESGLYATFEQVFTDLAGRSTQV